VDAVLRAVDRNAATSVALKASGSATYSCDANGNVTGGSTITGTYDLENRPTLITRVGVGTQAWTYNPLGEISTESSSKGTRYFGPSGYEVLGATGFHELGALIVERTNGVDNITTALRDRLGSTIATIDGGVQYTGSARGYDAFGKVRNFDLSDRAGGTLNLGDSIHGFTKHDHADDVQLIHMGGRVYDYSLGRFLQVDPVLSHQINSQSSNPYTYILNNPLSGTDPTGYLNCDADGNCTGFLAEVDKINVFKDGTVQAVTSQGATITLGNIRNSEVRNTFSAFLSGVIISGNGAITIAGTQFGPSFAPSAIESSTSRTELALQRGPRPLDGDATNGAVEAIASTISLSLARPLGETIHLFPVKDREQLEADNRAFKREYPWANVLLSLSINPKSLLKKLEKNAAQEGIKEGGEAAVNNIVQKETRLISNVKVTDRATGKVMQGTVDLKPTLDRIKAGGSHTHRNDGSIFQNRNTPLPAQPAGYYREYVHPTPGINGPGPQRIVVGQGGEIFYTPDHYATFIRVNP